MENTPIINTEHLILRKFERNDIKSLFLIFSDKQVNTFIPMFPLETIEDAENLFEKEYLKFYEKPIGYKYAVCLKSDNIPIGYVNVSDDDSHDFGYGLRKEYWHKGIITQASKAVVEILKKTDFKYITATHDVNNKRSGEVMKRIGMEYKYSYKEQWQPKNILVTFRMYQLNFDENKERVYKKYWNKYPVHFIEKDI